MTIDPRFIINLQGKDFVLYAGLLALAHEEGLCEVSTDIIQFPTQENGNSCIIRATVQTLKGTFTGIGDASPDNVGGTVKKHFIRMCETRALARALRIATNIGMTCLEELDEFPKGGSSYSKPEPQRTQQSQPQPQPQPKKQAPAPTSEMVAPKDISAIQKTMFGQGIKDAKSQLTMVGGFINKDLSNIKDLTALEAEQVMICLKEMFGS